jgi:hypothetical protein
MTNLHPRGRSLQRQKSVSTKLIQKKGRKQGKSEGKIKGIKSKQEISSNMHIENLIKRYEEGKLPISNLIIAAVTIQNFWRNR